MNITIASWLMMLISGVLESMKSLLVPYFQEEMALSANQTGILLSVSFYGVVFTNLMIGLFYNQTAIKKIMLYGLFVMAIALIGFSFPFPYVVLFALMLLLGSGISSVGITSNTVTAILHTERSGQMFIVLHSFFGLGALFGPVIIQYLLRDTSWNVIFTALAIIPVILLLYLSLQKVPTAKVTKLRLADLGGLLREPRFYQFVTLKFCYVGAELGFVTWIFGFLKEIHHFSPEKAALYISLFFGAFTLGRLIGSVIVERIGYFKMLMIHSLTALGCLIVTIVGPTEMMWVFILYGYALSIIFPTVTTIASTVYSDRISTVFGLLYAAAGLGGALTTWLIGYTYGLFNYRTAFIIPLVMMAVIVIMILKLRKNAIKEGLTTS